MAWGGQLGRGSAIGATGRLGIARRRAGTAVVALLALGASAAVVRADESGRIERIDLKTEAAATKVIVMLSRPLAFDVAVLDGEAARQISRRLVLDFPGAALAPAVAAPVKVDDGYVRQIRTGVPSPGNARLVLDLASDTTHAVEAYETPPHVTITIRATTGTPPPAELAPDPQPTTRPPAVHAGTPRPRPTPAAARPKAAKSARAKPRPTKTPAKARRH